MKAKHIFIMMILVFGIVSCTPKFIKNYEKSMIENPSTQAEKDQNVILQYLADNKLDFKSTESGIYYSIDNEGDGEGNPTTSDLVKTHYKGYRLDGKTFDSSYDRGEPIEFPLTGVIKGWQEAIPLLSKGGKGTFLIPSGLAYGARGAGADIPGNTVLIFDVELLDFYDPSQKAKKQIEADDKIITDYLAENGITDAKKTESGLYYTLEREGQGNHPTAASTVEVHYAGMLMDGTKFDSSYDRGQPAQFPLNRVIPGWTEGVQLLKPGGKARLYIPSSLGYGERGAGGMIPPNAVLMFDVELLRVLN